MVVVDANVLLYAANADDPHHGPASAWLEASLGGAEAVGFAWVVLLAFLRLSTNAAIFPRPLEAAEATEIVERWLAQPAAIVLHPTTRHLAILRGLLRPLGTAANLVNDAHLAALAVEHGARVVSFDADFGRFEGVDVVAPGQTSAKARRSRTGRQ